MADVLVFSAHPDDAEFGMGATLCKLKSQGLSIALCTLTCGESGTHGTPEQRKEEMHAAADYLDADIEVLEWPDCAVHDTQKNRCTLASTIRNHQPSIVFAPYHTNTGSHKDGRTHPDHSETGKLVRIAARYARFANIDGVQGEAHRIKHLFYYMYGRTVTPDFFIDVTEHMGAWRELADCHGSQTALKDGAVLEYLAKYRKMLGHETGCSYAEGFVCDDILPLEINELL